jgi:hypothetical protein
VIGIAAAGIWVIFLAARIYRAPVLKVTAEQAETTHLSALGRGWKGSSVAGTELR